MPNKGLGRPKSPIKVTFFLHFSYKESGLALYDRNSLGYNEVPSRLISEG
jgi:hypothetical protein